VLDQTPGARASRAYRRASRRRGSSHGIHDRARSRERSGSGRIAAVPAWLIPCDPAAVHDVHGPVAVHVTGLRSSPPPVLEIVCGSSGVFAPNDGAVQIPPPSRMSSFPSPFTSPKSCPTGLVLGDRNRSEGSAADAALEKRRGRRAAIMEVAKDSVAWWIPRQAQAVCCRARTHPHDPPLGQRQAARRVCTFWMGHA
jgi:hypothetical protein